MSETVPATVTFEQAIALAQSLLSQLERNEGSETEMQAAIASLVSHKPGARAFFATYLTDARPLADQPTSAVIRGLQSAPETVAEILVKNLAMSTAMAVIHHRNQDEALAAGSEQVQARTIGLINLLKLATIQDQAHQLQESLATDAGTYREFLNRWGYDTEQRQAIQQVLQQLHGQ